MSWGSARTWPRSASRWGGVARSCSRSAAPLTACMRPHVAAMCASPGRSSAAASLCPTLQLTIEALFLEAAARVVGAAPTHLTQQKGRDLEDLAFDWLLAGDANLAFPDPKNHKNWVGAAGRSTHWRDSAAEAAA